VTETPALPGEELEEQPPPAEGPELDTAQAGDDEPEYPPHTDDQVPDDTPAGGA
jgi:hypothetical protein